MADMGFIPYSIVSQRQTENLQPDGRFQEVWIVNFQSPSGIVSNVTIPANLYQPEYVDSVIQAQLRQIEATQRLGGEPIAPPS